MSEYDECPECGSDNFYESKCSNIDCKYCGGLFFFCNACGYTNHPECKENED